MAAGSISIQGSECANAGQTPILLAHKTPGLAASPGSCPSPSQAAPLPPNGPLARRSLRAPLSGPQASAEQPGPPGPKEKWGKMWGGPGARGPARREDSLTQAQR